MWALGAITAVILGVLINLAPNIIHQHVNGKNTEVGVRLPVEAEYYALKMIQLLLPRDGHRLQKLAEIKQQYNSTYPLINENSTATLGAIGSIGFLLACGIILFSLSGKRLDSRLSLLALFVLMLFLTGTMGGLGDIFSAFISSSIRGWNRISVFIAFATITLFFLSTQILIEAYCPRSKIKRIFLLTTLFVLPLGLYDQTVTPCQTCNEQQITFHLDKTFIEKIEQSLPSGSAIYQLPYMAFPENGSLHHLTDYSLATGFINSKTLRWSYAGMKGREGDVFYRSLSHEPIQKQLAIIRRLGFAGIYIDRRGYVDHADELIKQITDLIGAPTIMRADNEIVFFPIIPTTPINLDGLSSMQIMQKAHYVIDKLGKHYKASLAEGIDFTRPDAPTFVQNILGLSGHEPWGRWSDANEAPTVRIDFVNPLLNN